MLHDRVRPTSWDQFQGNATTVRKVRDSVERPGYEGGAMWICGPSGCGKTTMARLVAASSLQASEWDTHELDGDKCSVEAVRSLEREIGKSGGMFGGSGWRVWIVNEAHAMTGRAVQAWLNLLEGMPRKRMVIFTTTETAEEDLFGNFTGPLLSRCNVYKLQPPNEVDAALFLREVAQREQLDGQPIDAYVRLYVGKKRNLRAALSAIEAGEMLI